MERQSIEAQYSLLRSLVFEKRLPVNLKEDSIHTVHWQRDAQYKVQEMADISTVVHLSN